MSFLFFLLLLDNLIPHFCSLYFASSNSLNTHSLGVNSHYGLGAYGHANSYGGGYGRYPHDPIGADVRATDFYPRPAASDPLGVNMGLLNIA